MNILAVCHYGLYRDLSYSFVHNQLREYVKAGHRVRVLIPNGFGKIDRNGKRFSFRPEIRVVDGVELCDLRYLTLSSYGEKNFNAKSAICSIRLWKKLLLAFQPDVIHAHTVGFDSRIGAWLKKLFSRPMVATVHGSDVAVPIAQGKGEQLCRDCEEADFIGADSSRLAEMVRNCGAKTPLRVISNGFVLHKCEENIPRDPMKMIQVGHLIPSKRVDVSIRAFAILKKKYPQMTFTIIGKGVERDNLEALCRELKVEDAVTFTGEIENRRVFEALCGATYFSMVSKPEGFGIVYLEAMAAGCITIGTQGQGIIDVIRDGENGFLLPADDPQAIADVIEDCIEHPKKAEVIAKQGQADALNLTWETNAKKYLQFFEEIKSGL